ncbi:MAG: hypothetical protein WCL32_09535 [Planctomycetota bacterium]|jgi:hypothetical protein
MRFAFALCATLALGIGAEPVGKATVGGPVAPDGVEVQNDFPREFHIRNRGGSDGAGLCVFASLQQSAKWQDVEPLTGVFEWMKTRPGGGWPEKVDRVVDDMCRAKKLKKPAYLQIEGTDFELVRRACRLGRMPAVTYAFSPSGRYGGARIAHMVNLLHADERWCAVLDNNFPGTIEWMTPAEFQRVWTGGGQGWAVILLADGPPPPPVN